MRPTPSDSSPEGTLDAWTGTAPGRLPPDTGDQIAIEFLAAWSADRESGTPRPLADYLGRHPGHDAVIAREYLAAAGASADGTSPSGALALPGRIGPYVIEKELGRGGQAVVYLAEDLRLRRSVALKVLTGHDRAAPEAVDRFRREAGVAARIDHPGVCTVFDAGVDDGVAWIAMRLVEGETLARLIRTTRERVGEDRISTLDLSAATRPESAGVAGPPPPDPARQAPGIDEIRRVTLFVEKAARALHAAHEAGIIHRDVKPGNVMITPAGEPVLLDFGLARDLDGDGPTLTRPGDIFGTPHYMSPEQIAAQRVRLDRRTDVYSLGVVLHECLTLRRPFEAGTREGLYQAILMKDAPSARALNPAVPRDLAVVTATAMARDRDRRYQTALDFAEDLRRVREHLPIQARPPGLLVRTVRWFQRHPVAATVAVLAVAGALVAAAAAGYGRARALEQERTVRRGFDAAAAELALGRTAEARAALAEAMKLGASASEAAEMMERIAAAAREAESSRARRAGDEIEGILEGLRAEMGTAQGRIDRLTAERQEVARLLVTAREDGSAGERIRTVELNLEVLDRQIDDERSRQALLGSASDRIRSVVEELRREVLAAREIERERKALESSLLGLRNDLAMAEDSRRATEAELAHNRKQLVEVEGRLLADGGPRRGADPELAELRKERDRLRREIEERDLALAESKDRLGKQEEQAKATISELRRDFERFRREMAPAAGAPAPAAPTPAASPDSRLSLRNRTGGRILVVKVVPEPVPASLPSGPVDAGDIVNLVFRAPTDRVTVTFRKVDTTGTPVGVALERTLPVPGPAGEAEIKE